MPQFTGDRRKVRDRRVAPREATEGIVEISFSHPVPTRIHAELLETSAVGFRASYDAKALEPGREVSFARNGRRGDARVIWTHVADGRRVSGFLVLSNDVAGRN